MNSSYFFAVMALALLGASSLSAQAQTSITSTPPSVVGLNQTFGPNQASGTNSYFQYTASGFSGTVTYTVTAGQLPPGLSFSPTIPGLLIGTPLASDIPTPPAANPPYTGTVTATDTTGDTPATQSFTITVNTTVLNSTPEGALSYTITPGTNYISVPLSNDPVYTDVVSAVTSNTISVANTTAFTGNLATLEEPTSSVPYFVKFLAVTPPATGGLQAGRVLLVTANTANTLTLDTTDHTSQSVGLTAANNLTNFSVTATSGNVTGDPFEVFAGDTLGTLFGVNTTQSPLILTGASTSGSADDVSLYSPSLSRFVSYYFNTSAGYWEQVGSTVNANNTIIYPYTGLLITRRSGSLTFSLTGRVTEANHLIKVGVGSPIYNSTSYPVNMTLSQLNLPTPWQKATTANSADTLSIWNTSETRFDSYFQYTDGTWRKVGGGSTDQSSFVVHAGTSIVFVKRTAVAAGVPPYLVPAIPYTLN